MGSAKRRQQVKEKTEKGMSIDSYNLLYVLITLRLLLVAYVVVFQSLRVIPVIHVVKC